MKASAYHYWQIIPLLLLAITSNTAAAPSPRRNFIWKHNDRPPVPSSNNSSIASVPNKKTTGYFGEVKNVNRHKMVQKDRDHPDRPDHHHFFQTAFSSKVARPKKLNQQPRPAQPPKTEEHHELHEHKLLLEFSHQLMESLPVQ